MKFMKSVYLKRAKSKKRTFSWMNPKLKIIDTKKYGKGVFAKSSISKDEILFVMGGYILNIIDENRLKGEVADKPIEVSEWFSIGPIKPSDMELMPQHRVNHSCDPNTGFKGSIFMVAMRNIKKGEEILYDYAMITHSNPNSKNFFTMKCECGSKNCRGEFREDDWMIPKLQKKYNGYFQWYIQDKINNKNKI
jgi:uncharacterized protein